MKEQLLSQLVPLLITFIVGALTTIIKTIGDVFIAFITEKKKEVIAKIGQTQYESNLAMAKSVWLIVEEHFRINKIVQNITTEKIEMFDKLLLEKIPCLNQEDIDHLRQAVAGEMNKGKKALFEDETKQQQLQIQTENGQLKQENEQLKQKLATVQNAVA